MIRIRVLVHPHTQTLIHTHTHTHTRPNSRLLARHLSLGRLWKSHLKAEGNVPLCHSATAVKLSGAGAGREGGACIDYAVPFAFPLSPPLATCIFRIEAIPGQRHLKVFPAAFPAVFNSNFPHPPPLLRLLLLLLFAICVSSGVEKVFLFSCFFFFIYCRLLRVSVFIFAQTSRNFISFHQSSANCCQDYPIKKGKGGECARGTALGYDPLCEVKLVIGAKGA